MGHRLCRDINIFLFSSQVELSLGLDLGSVQRSSSRRATLTRSSEGSSTSLQDKFIFAMVLPTFLALKVEPVDARMVEGTLSPLEYDILSFPT